MSALAIKQRALYEIDKAILVRKADRATDDFYTFFKEFAWPVLEPTTQYIDNWHIHAICDHLQAVSRGELTRLIINIPFRMLKSTLISQAWPAWEWINKPSTQWLTASFAKDLAIRDAVASRNIIESEAYKECWGDRFQMSTDQNVKSRYENNRMGKRFVTSTESGATGFGGNRICIDDPLNAKDADSEVARKASIEWFKGTISTRFNDPKKDAAVVTHQRLHEMDLTGWLINEQPNVWEHLVLPMRYDVRRTIFTGGVKKEVDVKDIPSKIGFVDPRTEHGELLSPKRSDEETVKLLEVSIGPYHTASQLQQNPTSRGGVIFQRGDWKFYKALPQLDEIIISADCTFKDLSTSDFVAIQVIGRAGANKYLIKRIKERMGFSATVMAIRTLQAQHSSAIAVLVEDKANGSAVIESIKTSISGVIAINPDGGKVARAFAIQPQHVAGNFYLPDPSIEPSIEVFLNELSTFPNGVNDDEVDCWTQGINWFASRERSMGIFDLYREDANQIKQEQEQKRIASNG